MIRCIDSFRHNEQDGSNLRVWFDYIVVYESGKEKYFASRDELPATAKKILFNGKSQVKYDDGRMFNRYYR